MRFLLFTPAGIGLFQWLNLAAHDEQIVKTFYSAFQPDQNVE